MKCRECDRELEEGAFRIVDNVPVCLMCLCGDPPAFAVLPIGVVSAVDGPGGGLLEIWLHPGMTRFMRDLSEETGLTVIWIAHQPQTLHTTLVRGWDQKDAGLFATRSPARLNPICVTDVDLISVTDNILLVRGLDALPGTPVIDIKPSLASLKNSRPSSNPSS
ncbi:hypothetical protein CCAX7_56030 [Capsulimonas corticalis]|uniref:Uncharacterized protein n=1 Tax=Capsulimonas corticalis TaxID=2219043 RepID=A0A402D0M7_9BACT|nr:TrmO family methyltransferase [Capsulimonas corticalis]BDI33552.1 hypothetical protein CCAX7_56030 [Capsulimonas corticalis]